MTSEFVLGLVVPIASALTFVAYYHPRQFTWLFYIYALLFMSIAPLGWVVNRVETNAIGRIRESSMAPDQKVLAEWVIKTKSGLSPEEDLAVRLVYYGGLYVMFLGLLPLIGLTDEARQRRKIV